MSLLRPNPGGEARMRENYLLLLTKQYAYVITVIHQVVQLQHKCKIGYEYVLAGRSERRNEEI